MTSHTNTIEKQRWLRVKSRIIARYGTVKAAARLLNCHPNAIRRTTSGHCPHVANRLKALLP